MLGNGFPCDFDLVAKGLGPIFSLANENIAKKRAAAEKAGQCRQLGTRDLVKGFSVTYLKKPQ
ncbi:MAG TPA: hypothetical protein VGK65_12760 [Candidatus Binatia bacterium]